MSAAVSEPDPTPTKKRTFFFLMGATNLFPSNAFLANFRLHSTSTSTTTTTTSTYSSAKHIPNPSTRPSYLRLSRSSSTTVARSSNLSSNTDDHWRQHRTQLAEGYHQTNALKAFISELSRKGSSPLGLLIRDGDWPKEYFWPSVRFLVGSGRIQEALQVFDCWTKKDRIRTNEANYATMIQLLSEEGFMEEALSKFQDMEQYGIMPNLKICNDLIHGFAKKKEFEYARATLSRMTDIGLMPTPETYIGFIRAYGNFGMYDEMAKCLKLMESRRCSPNEVTYNILIKEFARGRLFERMEGVYRTLRSKRMNLQTSTMVSMLEAYADLGLLEKMEKAYHRVLKAKGFIKENLVRKVATVYIENNQFSRLEDLGNDIGSQTGRTNLVWCLLLLASACLSSRKGIESVIQEMEVSEVRWNITFRNILALFYLKFKDFKKLDAVFSRAGMKNIELDMVTVGVLFDACRIGYDGTNVLELWRNSGVLEEAVEMKTESLVLIAFGKGSFVRECEKRYNCRPRDVQKKLWSYRDLISSVFQPAEGSLNGS